MISRIKNRANRWCLGAAMICAITLCSAVRASGGTEPLSDDTLANLSFEQKLDAQISLDLRFIDETGKQVHIGDFLGRQPALLVLGYYECPMLCTLVLNGMVEGLEDIKWSIGRDFSVINVSINPKETPVLAAAKKRTYLKRYGRGGAAEGWHFLTGNEQAIHQLAEQVGFQYAYDKASRQYAHPSGLVILSPNGKVSGYLLGVTYSPKELFSAIQVAYSNKSSSPIRNLVLLCFHYNPIRGKYSQAIMAMVRGLALITVVGLAWLVTSGAFRRKKSDQAPALYAGVTDDRCASSEPTGSMEQERAK